MSWLARILAVGNVIVLALIGVAITRLLLPAPQSLLPARAAPALRLPPERRVDPPTAALATAVFNVDRRLPVEAALTPTTPALPPPVLVGVVRPRTGIGLALMSEGPGSEVKVVRVGQALGDWRLIGVDRGEVRMARGAEPPVMVRIAQPRSGASRVAVTGAGAMPDPISRAEEAPPPPPAAEPTPSPTDTPPTKDS